MYIFLQGIYTYIKLEGFKMNRQLYYFSGDINIFDC